eukprot:TRINITY_DN4102_c0_g1_i3.p1 TRINITY_DN4102_c0_g1~~TRINITY_DN4102_c0_g1_i3.p1  ORF type:complete len:762 (-),score=153.60 TRINITY_DN4102_c0_g1_i3:393-2633(-)
MSLPMLRLGVIKWKHITIFSSTFNLQTQKILIDISSPNHRYFVDPVLLKRNLSGTRFLMASRKKEEKEETESTSIEDSLSAFRKDKMKKRKKQLDLEAKYGKSRKLPVVDVWNDITIRELGKQCDRSPKDIRDVIMSMDVTNKNKSRKLDTVIYDGAVVKEIVRKLGFRIRHISNPNTQVDVFTVDKDAKPRPDPNPEDLVPRPPVVTIMGHIDHGKTSLLDYLRKSRIVAGEHGGITQHIGAFTVKLESLEAVTFIDTPGHAAFSGMRERGANITDIVILIIDSCEGVLEQTKESLRMIRQARAPFIVALNKIDKPNSDVDMVKKQLKDEGVLLEEFGGDVQCVPISALKGTNVNKLIEEVLALAEILELRCDKSGLAEGSIIESQVEKGFGKTATVLVHRGTLKPSQFLVGDKSWCKVRLLLDDQGRKLAKVEPSQAAKVVGWKDQVPGAGAEILCVESEARAKEVAQWRRNKEMQETAELQVEAIEEYRKEAKEKYMEHRALKSRLGYHKLRYDNKLNPRQKESAAKSDHPKISIIIKGDVDGSVEAILDCLETYTCPEVELDIVSFGVGEVAESDLVLAEQFNAIIYAFNTTSASNIEKTAQSKNVSIRSFNVIYHMINDLKNEINDNMPEIENEDIVGKGQVLQEFLVTVNKKKVPIAGTKVVYGKITMNTNVRVERNGQEVYDGKLAMLKHHKDEVDEVKSGMECGLKVDNSDLKFESGDEIICYTTTMDREKTSWDPGF